MMRDRALFDQSPQPMWAFEEQTLRFVDVNAAAIALYGYSRDEFLGMAITDIRSLDDLPRLFDELQSDVPAFPLATWNHRRKDGSTIEVEELTNRVVLDGCAARLVAVRDVSRRREDEERLRQAQKMETVGQLAGGVAHDFNNLLAAIVGHTDLLSEYFATADPRAIEVAGIRHAADLAARLTRQLLEFSRKGTASSAVANVNDVIAHARPILARILGERIEVIAMPAAGVRSVNADARQLERVLLNLVVNARDAMPAGGRITLTTRNVRVDAALAKRRSVMPGDYVELSVADTGIGMDARTRQRLFEPFFTTKARRRGTGLGLAAVHGIVQRSGGHITVASESGAGACFTIHLPAAAEQSAAIGEHARRRAPAAGAVHGRETVLVVEDDAAVRSLIANVLERRGYRLMLADSGDEALRLAQSEPSPIDLLITDVVMARMNGIEVADAVRARRPDTKVLYVSGWVDDTALDASLLPPPGLFLNKPFTPDTLARKVRSVLDVQ